MPLNEKVKIMEEFFNEKYRPTEFEDVVGLDPEIPKLVADGNIPHLLFKGPAGTGKTTVAKIIVKKLGAEALVLNSSKDRGIDVIRNKIEPFAKKASDKLKIIFLDEFDDTTKNFQTALRNFMETHARTTRFIATCNYPNKIIDPVKSRFAEFEFSRYDENSKFQRIKKVAEGESIQIDDETLLYLVKKYKDDIRRMINFLNKNKGKTITKDDISYENRALSVLAYLKDKKWFDIRKELLGLNLDYPSLMDEMDNIIFTHTQIPVDIKRQANILCAKYMAMLNHSFSPELCFAAFMAELQEILKW